MRHLFVRISASPINNVPPSPHGAMSGAAIVVHSIR